MELPRRKSDDVYLADGTFTSALRQLARHPRLLDANIGIFYCFDIRTRMLPFWYVDRRMAPCSVRTLADTLNAAGFRNLRVVLQQWSPNVRPSLARIDGRPLDILLVSAMQVHGEPSYDLIRDAHRLGENRPLILAGGPKYIYEPVDAFDLGPTPGIGADCAVTGEAFVLLDLLMNLAEHQGPTDSPRAAFERARRVGDLDRTPGLVYLSPDAPSQRPVAIHTGVQRLLRDLDEMPMPDAGYRVLEAPHRRRAMNASPFPAHRVGKRSSVASLLATQGCKFNCSYCPIPAVNQRTWRFKSPQRMAAEIRHLHETFGIRQFFGTDDNFFNSRQTVIDLMTELARTKSFGQRLSNRIRFFTEATEFDVHKNRDLLPLCRLGGLRAIWFGIEDITAELVNKGQTAGKTAELFALLRRYGIEPMAMMIHNDDQPLRSRPGDLSGLLNQARYLFDTGAVSYQCTYLGPAIGTRDIEPSVEAKLLYKTVGGERIPEAFNDGNHVVASRHPRPWDRQLNVLRAYASFYNPKSMLRILSNWRKDRLAINRLAYQVIGQIGLAITIPKHLLWARKLKRGPIEVFDGLQPARIPLVDATSGEQIHWALQTLPAQELPTLPIPRKERPRQPAGDPREAVAV